MASNNGHIQDFKIEKKHIRLSDIRFNESVYPRKNGHNPAVVERYAGEIEEIEAAGAYITVAADMDLLDGRHRWLGYLTAYQSEPDREIPVRVAEVSSEADKYLLAVRLNSRHGFAFSSDDRQHSAIQLYNLGWPVETVARELSVKTATVSGWLSRTIKENRDKQNGKIKALWRACYTNQEIGEVTGLSEVQVRSKTKVIADSFPGKESAITFPDDHESDNGAVGGGLKPSKSDIASALHESDFDIPIYNVWKQQEKSNAVGHFGNSEQRWLDNLLYLYTKPLDIVIDPFAGGGSTIDVCKKRWRRYWAGDRKPKVSRDAGNELGGIRTHDLISESGIAIPDLRGRWENVKLVYLDPPYWIQAAGQYSDDPTDLANMPLDQFNKALADIINGFAKKLSDAYIALIIQPTQWKAPERQFTDHVGDMLRAVKLPVDMRFSVPYESQQCNAQMVEWAKENKRCLVLTREIVVWRVA